MIVLGSMVGDEDTIETIKFGAVKIICRGFLTILNMNNVLIQRPLKIIQSDQLVGVDFVTYDVRHNRLYFCMPSITQFLEHAQYPINIKMGAMDMGEMPQSSGRPISHQSEYLKLLVIADHLATHYIELYKLGSTDWINHTHFGSTIDMLTLHGQLMITGSNHSFGLKQPVAEILIRRPLCASSTLASLTTLINPNVWTAPMN